jgi:hypothetical protein
VTYHDMDPNRRTDDPLVNRPVVEDRGGMGYGLPIALAVIAIVLGTMFLMPSNDRTTTAANDAPASRQVNPSTPTPAPAATPAPPVKTQ